MTPNPLIVYSLWVATFAFWFALESAKLFKPETRTALTIVRSLNLLVFLILFGLLTYTTGIQNNAQKWRLITRWAFLIAWFPFVLHMFFIFRGAAWLPDFTIRKNDDFKLSSGD